jgi:hypothetical protein
VTEMKQGGDLKGQLGLSDEVCMRNHVIGHIASVCGIKLLSI